MGQRWLAIAWILVLATSCSCRTDIRVRGSMRGAVTFEVDGLHDVTWLAVETRDFAGGWREVWSVRGAGRTPEIVYGKVPEGMTSNKAAEPLRQKTVYIAHVAVKGGVFGPPECPGDVLFVLNDAGLVRSCSDVTACAQLAGTAVDARQ